MKAILGIDPGSPGCLALLYPDDSVVFHDIKDSIYDAIMFIHEHRDSIAGVAIERVHALPVTGRAAAFRFGSNYGHLRGACIALKLPIVAEPTPRVWQRYVGIQSADRRGRKRESRDRARLLFPQVATMVTRETDSHRSDALLIAYYGRTHR